MSAQAIILLGGLGTRLSALYPDRPKALVPVAGRPFVEWQLDWLRRGGVTDVHFAAGFKAEFLADWLRNTPAGRGATLSTEPQPLGTGGALRYCAPQVRSDPFFVLNGDSLSPRLEFAAMLRAFTRDGHARVLIAVAPIEEAGRFGTVEFDDARQITAFREKASRSAGWVNAGVYLMNRAALDLIPAGRKVSIEEEIFPALTAAGHLHAFPIQPPMLDMGTPDGLKAMEDFLKKT